MQVYGTVKSHNDQRDFRVKELIKSYIVFMATVLIVCFFIWMFIGDKYMNVWLPFVLISGFVKIAFDHLKDLAKIYDRHIELLLVIGEKNTVFINTIEGMIKKNGCVNSADLKGLMSEIFWENKHLHSVMFEKSVDKNSYNDKDHKLSELYIKYSINEKILDCIKTILKTESKN
ncbi:hypothetical protein MASRES_GEN12929_17020 [Acinetobacter baumannii]